MSSTTDQRRDWTGPAILSAGFRPFFFGGAVWAALSMAVWIPMQTGHLTFPTAFDPVSWHAHELLFGYLGAVIAGFLLTAVPNWTGRLPIVGWSLGWLVALWAGGRVAVAVSLYLPDLAVVIADLAFPVVLSAVVTREIVAGRNWRNLMVPGMLAVFALANALFHWEAARGTYAAQGFGLRLGLAAALMMIAVIGGRIVPAFTRNWLVRNGGSGRPAAPMQGFDKLALLVLLAALALWVIRPDTALTGVALAAAGLLHILRLARWSGARSVRAPLLLVLHIGYALLPLGALAVATETLVPGFMGVAPAQHVWMAGALGLMTLAVMTRATLGHSGRELSADTGTVLIYLALLLAVVARVAVGIWPGQATVLQSLSGAAWMAAFGGFAGHYGPLLIRRQDTGS